MNKILILLITSLLVACGPDSRSLEYKKSEISGIIDSVIIYKPLDTKKFFFSVNEKWYVIPGKYYVDFIHYISKGDSINKESGRWEISVFKKKNGRYIEKYFSGAQDDWE